MDELTKLVEFCRKLGASPQQADTMARQLLKRAEQLAIERKQSREEAMAYLLKLVTQGNAGLVPPEFSSEGGKSE
jgi:hypothetical protein